jgi:hypothetical protein
MKQKKNYFQLKLKNVKNKISHQVDEDCSRDVLSAGCFIVINVDPFELKIRSSDIGSGGIDAVLIRNDLPELKYK